MALTGWGGSGRSSAPPVRRVGSGTKMRNKDGHGNITMVKPKDIVVEGLLRWRWPIDFMWLGRPGLHLSFFLWFPRTGWNLTTRLDFLGCSRLEHPRQVLQMSHCFKGVLSRASLSGRPRDPEMGSLPAHPTRRYCLVGKNGFPGRERSSRYKFFKEWLNAFCRESMWFFHPASGLIACPLCLPVGLDKPTLATFYSTRDRRQITQRVGMVDRNIWAEHSRKSHWRIRLRLLSPPARQNFKYHAIIMMYDHKRRAKSGAV